MKNIMIVGIGRLGYYVIQEMNRLKVEILAIDKEEEKLKRVVDDVSKTIIGDSTDLEFLKTIGINNFDECVVTIGDNFQASLETVLNLKQLGAKKVTARASMETQEQILKKIGADEVIYPEKHLAKWTALHLATDSIYDFMELDNGYGIYEVTVPEKWVGKTLAELDLRKKYGINIIGVKEGKKVKVILGPNFVLTENERLFIIAKEEDANKVL